MGASANGTLLMVNTLIDNTAGVIRPQASGTVELYGAILQGGQISVENGGTFRTNRNANVGTLNLNGVDISIGTGGTFSVLADTTINGGQLSLQSGGTLTTPSAGTLRLVGSRTIENDGTIVGGRVQLVGSDVVMAESGQLTVTGSVTGRSADKVPHGHWKTTTFVAALRCDGLTAPLVIDGAMNGALFLAYVEQQLVPTLRPGDLVVMDNLCSA